MPHLSEHQQDDVLRRLTTCADANNIVFTGPCCLVAGSAVIEMDEPDAATIAKGGVGGVARQESWVGGDLADVGAP
ncbi:hypothetical protein LWC35_33230 [Pseudonocardia kujensis]|uniref:hypothetical protein n=1 Tax=Pseudonocardia kujensis TaxID=1128675 RepID=UPI001E4A11C7|nr:hypothetical protein [Pseudonocardia kujensis]MCE0767725.1 hypothetical protein [Pseudonocardia kujensis]